VGPLPCCECCNCNKINQVIFFFVKIRTFEEVIFWLLLQWRKKMVTPDGAPLKCARFLVNSAVNPITEVYAYFKERYPEAGTARPIRSTVATANLDSSPNTKKHTTNALDHSDAQERMK